MKHHTKEEKKEILDALREGQSMQDVTKVYDVSYASIHRWQLTEGESDIPRQSYTLKEKAEILIAMEEAGQSPGSSQPTMPRVVRNQPKRCRQRSCSLPMVLNMSSLNVRIHLWTGMRNAP